MTIAACSMTCTRHARTRMARQAQTRASVASPSATKTKALSSCVAPNPTDTPPKDEEHEEDANLMAVIEGRFGPWFLGPW